MKREYETQFNVEVSPPLGFDNTFAILVRGEDARRFNLKTVSNATRYARQWHAGFGHDFMVRPDGYPGFSRTYGLDFASVSDMALDLTYTALASHKVDLIAGNSTDGRIASLDLVQLEDDRHYFPPYEAVFLGRKDTLARMPQLAAALQKLEAYSKRLPMDATPSTAHLFIIKPFTGEALMRLFSTHPSTADRIARLERMPG